MTIQCLLITFSLVAYFVLFPFHFTFLCCLCRMKCRVDWCWVLILFLLFSLSYFFLFKYNITNNKYQSNQQSFISAVIDMRVDVKVAVKSKNEAVIRVLLSKSNKKIMEVIYVVIFTTQHCHFVIYTRRSYNQRKCHKISILSEPQKKIGTDTSWKNFHKLRRKKRREIHNNSS